MNWLKKGPELKMFEMKIPDFLYDLFYDLKERHLLPLVAVLIVAMVAAPIYFKGKSKPELEAPPVGGVAATASSVAGGGETIVVARSEPGLRDYKRRLRNYRALDPFRGGEAENAGANTEASNASPAASTPPPSPEVPTEATVVGGETAAPPAAPIEVSSTPESSGGPTKTRYASDSIDVRIVTVRHESSGEKAKKKTKPKAEIRRDLPELTMLPARQAPAATYMGLSNDGKKALFVVSSDVVSLFGEGKCVIGSQSCQLLMLEPGLPETFVYGPQEHTYRIELLKIDQAYSSKPRRATLGATKGKNHSEGGAENEGTEAGGTTGKDPTERGNG